MLLHGRENVPGRERGLRQEAAAACGKALNLNASGHHVKEARRILAGLEGNKPK